MDKYSEVLKFKESELFANLDSEQLFYLAERILLKDIKGFEGVFLTNRFSTTTEEAAFDWLSDLSHINEEEVKRKIEYAFQAIYDKAINGQYKHADEVMLKLNAIIAQNKIGLSKKYITDTAKENILPVIKTKLLILLSILEPSLHEDFWEEIIKAESAPYLAPAYIAAFKRTDPIKALGILRALDFGLEDNIVDEDNDLNLLLESQIETGLYFALPKVRENDPDDKKELLKTRKKELLEIAESIQSKRVITVASRAIEDPYFERNFSHFKSRFIKNLEKEAVVSAFELKEYERKYKGRSRIISDLPWNSNSFQELENAIEKKRI